MSSLGNLSVAASGTSALELSVLELILPTIAGNIFLLGFEFLSRLIVESSFPYQNAVTSFDLMDLFGSKSDK